MLQNIASNVTKLSLKIIKTAFVVINALTGTMYPVLTYLRLSLNNIYLKILRTGHAKSVLKNFVKIVPKPHTISQKLNVHSADLLFTHLVLKYLFLKEKTKLSYKTGYA